MSCVVGVRTDDRIVILGDSASCNTNQTHVQSVSRKVFVVGNRLIIGFAGAWRAGQVLEQDLYLPRRLRSYSDYQYVSRSIVRQVPRIFRAHRVYEDDKKKTPPDINLLVGFNGVIYRVEADFSIHSRDEGYDAIGSGEEFALGSLHTTRRMKNPERRAVKALEASASHCPWVTPPWVGYALSPEGLIRLPEAE